MEPNDTKISVEEVMRQIRESVQRKRHVPVAVAHPSPPPASEGLPAMDFSHLRTLVNGVQEASLRVGQMPPVPPTARGRIGAVLVQVVRRMLFWHTAQLGQFGRTVKTTLEEQANLLEAVSHITAEGARLNELLRAHLESLERQLEAAGEAASQTKQELKEQFEATAAAQEGLRAQLASYQERLHEAEGQIAAEMAAREGLARQLSLQAQRSRALEEQIAAESAARQALAGQLVSQAEDSQVLEGQIAAQSAVHQTLAGQLTSQAERSRDLEEQMAAESARREALSRRLASQVERSQIVKQQLAGESAARQALAGQLASQAERSRVLEEQTTAEIAAREALGNRLDFDSGERQRLEERFRQREQQVARLKVELVQQERRLNVVLEEARKRLPEPFDREQLRNLIDEEQHRLEAVYASFEDEFRGTREEIKERFRVYLPYLHRPGRPKKDIPVLDLGCGRGEWLELLQEKGFPAQGVDSNRIMVARCRDLGLQVNEGDLLSHLRGLPDSSIGAITGFHIIEHLPWNGFIDLLEETVRLLKPGGVAIFETPNPGNVLVGSHNFYLDPTHRSPLPAPLVRFMVEARGLCKVEVLFLHPYPEAAKVSTDAQAVAERFNEYFYGPQDYAVIGRKV